MARRIARRDHPDILERMKAGEYSSVRAVALEAGIVKKDTSGRRRAIIASLSVWIGFRLSPDGKYRIETPALSANAMAMTSTRTARPTSRRRWLRFSLATLLLGILLFCACLGFQRYRATQQTKAVAALADLGCAVIYEHQFDAEQPLLSKMDAEPPGPTWAREFVGADYFQTVVAVEVPVGGILLGDSAQLIEHCEELPNLQCVIVLQGYPADDGESKALDDFESAITQRIVGVEFIYSAYGPNWGFTQIIPVVE